MDSGEIVQFDEETVASTARELFRRCMLHISEGVSGLSKVQFVSDITHQTEGVVLVANGEAARVVVSLLTQLEEAIKTANEAVKESIEKARKAKLN